GAGRIKPGAQSEPLEPPPARRATVVATVPGQPPQRPARARGTRLPEDHLDQSMLSRTRSVSSPTKQTITIRSGETASRGTASRLANTAIPTITSPIVKRDDLIEELRRCGLMIPS